jgi:predicted transposase YbfD/YdcC
VISLKGNQSKLHKEVIALFEQSFEKGKLESDDFDWYETHEYGHGREEWRQYWTTDALDELTQKKNWAGLRTVVMVERERTVRGKTSTETTYYISSLEKGAKQIGESIRGHWGIENSVHWILDMAFREDESRVSKGHAPENLAVIRHIALNCLRQEKTAKMGIKNRRLRAGWDPSYLCKVLDFI